MVLEVLPHTFSHHHKTYILPQPPAPRHPACRHLTHSTDHSPFSQVTTYLPKGTHTVLCPFMELFPLPVMPLASLLWREPSHCHMDGLLTALTPPHGTLCLCIVPFLHAWFTQGPAAARPHHPMNPDIPIFCAALAS